MCVGGTYAIIQTKCCVFIPDKFANISSLLAHMKTQVKALNNLAPSLGDQLTHWFGSGGGSMLEEIVTDTWSASFNFFLYVHVLLL